jgi:hypothetical protein
VLIVGLPEVPSGFGGGVSAMRTVRSTPSPVYTRARRVTAGRFNRRAACQNGTAARKPPVNTVTAKYQPPCDNRSLIDLFAVAADWSLADCATCAPRDVSVLMRS